MAKHHVISITHAENGGFTVRHHVPPKMSKSGAYTSHEEPVHAFEDGEGMIAHVKEHFGVGESEAEERDEEKVSPGIHKKVAKMEEA